MDLIGTTIGPYQIVEAIGHGGMASVFKARQPALGRFVAIKVLMPQQSTPEFYERFTREAKAIAQLNHANILPVIDFGQDRGITYIVMKYVSGGTLAQRLKRPIDLSTTAHLITQIAAALDHAHNHHLIHRDVKPSNVLLDEGEWVQLADFGLAKILGSDQTLTSSGLSLGTPAYLSPEQGQGLSLDHHTDIYSLGVTLFEMTTGRLPFVAETSMRVIFKHIFDAPPPPRSLNPTLPEAIDAIILRALAKSMHDRFHRAGDLAEAFQQAVSQAPALTVPAVKITDPQAAPKADEHRPTPTPITISRKLLMEETAPVVAQFVGRETELAAYRSRLERDRFVIITGMAGMGKTTLGAKLAREVAPSPDNIFWFTFDHVEKSTAEALYWALAAFLDSRGEPSLWTYLHGEVGAQKPLERMAKLNLLIAALSTGNHVLCFDDCQVAAHVPDIAYTFKIITQRFVDLHQDLPARIILMGREVSPDLEYLVPDTLQGLSEEETAAFIAHRRVNVPRDLIGKLWQRTEGNPKLLELSVSALSSLRESTYDTFIAGLARKGDIRDYLMTNLYAALEPEEQLIMGALSVFPGAIERDGAEEILAEEGVSKVARRIDALIDKHVVGEVEEGHVHLHSLVRDYCYHVVDRRDRERFHARAAEYYEQERNYLAAAYHHFERKQYGPALELLTTHSGAIINAGGAGALLEQLGKFQRDTLAFDQRVALNKTKGDGYRLRGDYQAAIAAYEAAFEEADDASIRAEIQHLIGSTYLKVGDYPRALEHSIQSLSLSEALNNPLETARAHQDMAAALYYLGRLDEADEHLKVSERIGRELNNRRHVAEVSLGLGLIAWRRRHWEEARLNFETSRHIYQEQNDRRGEAYALINLGLLCGEMNEVDRQFVYYQQALSIHTEIGDVDALCTLYNNLGYLHFSRGNYSEALSNYERLAQLSTGTGNKYLLTLAHAGLADAYRAQGNQVTALEHARRARQFAEDSGLDAALGLSLRALGDIWLSLDQFAEARLAFEASLPLLERAQEIDELNKARLGYAAADVPLTATPSS